MILCKPALIGLNPLIPAGPNLINIQLKGIVRFAFKELIKVWIDIGQVSLATHIIEVEVP